MPNLDINRLNNLITALSDSKTALAAKGVTVPAGALLDDLPGLIAQVPSGDPDLPTAPPKDVNFYDYNGEIRYSYTLAQAAALEALPALPTHSGLTGVGWNYTLAEVKALTRPCRIGAIYKSADNKSHFKLVLSAPARLSPYILLRISGTVKVDWGDGSTVDTLTASQSLTGWSAYSHIYSAPGTYDVTIEVISGTWNGAYGKSCLFAVDAEPANNAIQYYQRCVRDVILGITAAEGASGVYPVLNSMYGVVADRVLVNTAIQLSDGARSSQLSNGALRCFHIPQGATTIQVNTFKDCAGLLFVTIPASVTSIGSSAFSGCYGLSSVILPNVQSIAAGAFTNCTGVAYYDFSRCTSVPSLAATNAFTGIRSDCKIIVPDSLATSWKGETNWVTYADNIISASDYAAL